MEVKKTVKFSSKIDKIQVFFFLITEKIIFKKANGLQKVAVRSVPSFVYVYRLTLGFNLVDFEKSITGDKNNFIFCIPKFLIGTLNIKRYFNSSFASM